MMHVTCRAATRVACILVAYRLARLTGLKNETVNYIRRLHLKLPQTTLFHFNFDKF
jgi:hypothetical protein